MEKEELDKLLFYKKFIEKAKIELLEDFHDKLNNLVQAEKIIELELKKYKGVN